MTDLHCFASSVNWLASTLLVHMEVERRGGKDQWVYFVDLYLYLCV